MSVDEVLALTDQWLKDWTQSDVRNYVYKVEAMLKENGYCHKCGDKFSNTDSKFCYCDYDTPMEDV